MRQVVFLKKFKKDMKRLRKRGYPEQKLKDLVDVICQDGEAPAKCRPHLLTGNWAQRSECHIEFDWLLIYKVEETQVIFYRTGTHADLF